MNKNDEMQNQDEDGEKFDVTLVREVQGFDEKERPVQKVFWVLMGLFLTAGALGVFGGGYLSKGRVEGAEFSVEYEKLVRAKTPNEMHIVVKSPQKGIATVVINNAYLRNVEIEKMVPRPATVRSRDGQSIFTFNASENGLIIFYLQPQHAGSQNLEIDIGGEQRKLSQFVYF